MKTYKNIGLLSLVIILLFPLYSLAQLLPEDRNYKIGVKGGLNFSTLTVLNVTNERALAGLNLGVFFKQKINENFSVQPELLYSSKGSEITFDLTNFHGIAKINLNYLDLPVLLVFNPTPYFNIHIGPYFGVLIYTNIKTINEPVPDEIYYDLGAEITGKNFKAFDAGMMAGVGVEIGIFNAGMRYNFGMVDVGKTKRVFGKPYGFPGAQNQLAQLYVGVGF